MKSTLALRTVRILWGALSFSIVLFFVVLNIMVKQRDAGAKFAHSSHAPKPPDQTMLLAMVGLATVVAIASFLVPAKARADGAKSWLATHPAQGNPTVVERKAMSSLIARTQTPFILSMALSEAVALFGFAIGNIGGPWAYSGSLMGAGLVLALLRFPTRDFFFSEVQKLAGCEFVEADDRGPVR